MVYFPKCLRRCSFWSTNSFPNLIKSSWSVHYLFTFGKASPLKRWLVISDSNQNLSLLAVEKRLSGEDEVAGLIKSSFVMRIMFGISSFSLSGQVLVLLCTSLKHPILQFDIMARNLFASTSRVLVSISSPYISCSEAGVSTSMFPVGVVACIKRYSKFKNTLKLGWSNLLWIELMKRFKTSKNITR